VEKTTLAQLRTSLLLMIFAILLGVLPHREALALASPAQLWWTITFSMGPIIALMVALTFSVQPDDSTSAPGW
jgi:hypothetical protein